MIAIQHDVFAEAKAQYTIPDLWTILGLEGEPKPSCKSPFRDDHHPSFSVFDGGRAWKDHASGEGGDVISFVQAATGWSHSEIREWFMERIGIDHLDPPPPRPTSKPAKPKVIQWPCELLTGTDATWAAFGERKGLDVRSVSLMVEQGLLRFGTVDDHQCFIITDDEHRAAEIRRIDGEPFPKGQKPYPLTGVNKDWMPGAAMILGSCPIDRSWAICEGATDYLSLFDLYVRYRLTGGKKAFTPLAMLGAGIKRLCPDIMAAARGRTIVLIPDGDSAGDRMGDHWSVEFSKAGADVDTIRLQRGEDLRDLHLAGEIQPEDLFNG